MGNPTAVLATGGGSKNPEILQVLADVFGAPVYVSSASDSAAVGAALRAKHGFASRERGAFVPFGEIFGDFEETYGTPAVVPGASSAYEHAAERFGHLEEMVLQRDL